MIAELASNRSSAQGIARVGRSATRLWLRSSSSGRFGNDLSFRSIRLPPPTSGAIWRPALRKLTGAEFGHTQGRNFLYPGFLYLILRFFDDFRAIAIVQHLLGVAAGAVLLKRCR
jgi:hypothetical protein